MPTTAMQERTRPTPARREVSDEATTVKATPSERSVVNIAATLAASARRRAEQIAVAMPRRARPRGRDAYETVTFAQLNKDSDLIAAGLWAMGVEPGMRLVLLVPQSIDFIALTFGLFKAGVVTVLIDPGMGIQRMLDCLRDVKPDGFVGIPAVQVVRRLLAGRFPNARHNVWVGRKWLPGGKTLKQIRALGERTIATAENGFAVAPTKGDDPAAIIFTSGATGPPKGVLYRHGNFAHQVTEIRDFYGIEPGGTDVAAFPLFSLFNAGMGVTTVLPDMDPSRPARVDPARFVAAIRDWRADQSFASPAVWRRVGPYCEAKGVALDSLRRVLSAGAPVPASTLKTMRKALPEETPMHTPYGATESLPVASIDDAEVLGETAAATDQGAGVCVGRKFPDIRWRVVRISDDPIRTLADTEPLSLGEIGEIIVSGPVVTREYVHRPRANVMAKIADGSDVWHRIGDVGYFDEVGRFWYCGRKAHRVRAEKRTHFTIPCEAILNTHPHVGRSALVGVGPAGRQKPVAVIEPEDGRFPTTRAGKEKLTAEVAALAKANEKTAEITRVLIKKFLPVDVRHNSKINRETLAKWAASR